MSELQFERTDPATGATSTGVLLLHGLGGNSQVHYNLQQRAMEAHTTISLDFSGLGRSANRHVTSFYQWVDDAKSVIPEDVSQLLVVGHSMGTLVARYLAAEDTRVRGLLLAAPIMAPDDQTRQVFLDRAGDAMKEGMLHVADHFGLSALGSASQRQNPLARLVVRNFLMSQVAERYAAASQALSKVKEPEPIEHMLDSLYILRGLEDPISTTEVSHRVAGTVPSRQREDIALPSIGHWPTIEDPQASLETFEAALNHTFAGTPAQI